MVEKVRLPKKPPMTPPEPPPDDEDLAPFDPSLEKYQVDREVSTLEGSGITTFINLEKFLILRKKRLDKILASYIEC